MKTHRDITEKRFSSLFLFQSVDSSLGTVDEHDILDGSNVPPQNEIRSERRQSSIWISIYERRLYFRIHLLQFVWVGIHMITLLALEEYEKIESSDHQECSDQIYGLRDLDCGFINLFLKSS